MSVTHTNRRELLQKGALLAAGCLAGGPTVLRAAEPEQQVDPLKLKITGVKTYLLQHKLKRPFGVSVSVPLDQFRKTLLVKIETDAGLTGWGETAPVGGARGTIDDQIGPRLIGQNPLEQRKLWRMMWGPNFGNALAVAALDMAINDIRGQALNLSVAELFGGRLRDRVPAYASAMNYVENEQPEEQYPREAEQLVKQGFKALKMRIGRYPVVREAAVAAAVREAVGLDIKLMADGNAAYTLSSALQMGEVLHDLNFEYFEEPLPQSPHYAGYEELRRKLPLPLAAGEGVDSRGSAKELIDRQCMHIIQPDVSLCGGIGETLFISELAALSGIRCIPHCWGGAILIAATVQTLSLMPDPHWGFPTDTPMLELDQSENPWRTEIVKEPFQLKDGFVDVPTRPGLGIEVDEAIVKRYAI
ncbi:MAG: mandelate racemase [Gimesia sp.]|jgi:D-galactarolactone cycloisomerase|uniref:Mandelate racemase n=1 Tax=Gimesia maris TaxID=122 RepID=A0A3D3RD68_9PLAN|nr:mandelate racemase [Gimesia sp.]HCO26546.1 mandelate racemase [Gimesia maris]|tara:strand:- start:97281 stop:98531 length:1251 start_codon:yes stop_codon:yes gene_type:complete